MKSILWKNVFLIMVLVFCSLMIWFWMMGGLAVPPEMKDVSNILKKWAGPYFLVFPAVMSALMFVAALILTASELSKVTEKSPK